MYNSSSNNGRKVIASVIAILVAVAIIGAALLILRTPASAGTVTNVTEVTISEEEINAIVEKYLSEHPSNTLDENQIRAIITQLIAEYDLTRFDESGHCRCCGEHVTEVDRSTHTHTDNYIDRTVTIDNTVTKYVESDVDLSGYYSREEVDAIIVWLLGQINNGKGGSDQDPTFVQPDPGFEEEDPGFIPPEEGYEGEGAGQATDDTFVTPSEGNEGEVTGTTAPGFIPPEEGYEGEVTGQATDDTFVEPSEGNEGDGNFVNPSEGNENNGADQVTGQTIDLRGGSSANADNDFLPPANGSEGAVNGNTENDFVAPSNGSEGAVGTTEEAFVAPNQGYENDSDNEGGQVIDLTTGGNNTASNDDFVLPNPGVEFSGVDNSSNPSEGFIPPAEGTGYGE